MTRTGMIIAAALALAGCNATQDAAAPTPAVRSEGPVQPTPGQVAARDTWIMCLNREREAAAARVGIERAPDEALVRCRREEDLLITRLAQDPGLTPSAARAGLERVKADWRRAS